ncbi:GGDEF domain-containing protein [Komagataeibacter rhaeticus]|uniref:putative bifunctional diguanylate cyclase/phosphodiesterase n=1 Tax=Komagataeibacter rhaeticus TaxID=215221 RepID=UPI000D8595B9|nr:GGDEF domain-containing phosphodiesterase [Komagataeibacter rhaeticus]PYD53214.1 GGDEF domain-containing protein [Komagataeibacter rhaeticus]GBQ12800.1 diguanylate cyclase [Komagataeibacter rhaeticus DSM 16663]
MSLKHDDRLRALTHQDSDFWADVVDNVLIVAITDVRGVITYVNDRFCEISRYPREELLGSTHRIVNSGYHDASFFRQMYRTIRTGEIWRGNICNRAKDGTLYWVATTIMPKHNSLGAIEGYVATRFEITELMNTRDRLKSLAATDPLTGLFNRGGFNNVLQTAVEHKAQNITREIMLVMFDLDGFKQINDIHGHHAGDVVLKVISARLMALVSPEDAVCRLGGDEFALILDHTLTRRPLQDILDQLLAELEAPIEVGNTMVNVSGSIGVSPVASQESAESLQKNADIALYAAKRAGGHQARMFDITLHQHALERAQILTDARTGVEKDQFELYYQPILNLATGRCDQIEALLRWHHPQRGLLAAESFHDVFLDAALAQAMSPRLVKAFQNDMRLWNNTLNTYPNLTINLSRLDLLNIGFQNDLEAEIKRQGSKASDYVLEISESVLVAGRRSDRVLLRLQELAAMGFQLALDDFGLATLPISALRDIRFTQAKISRKLVREIEHDQQARDVIAHLSGLAHAFGQSVTVSGVETRGQMEILRAIGVDRIQGFYISLPISAANLVLAEHIFAPDHTEITLQAS